MLSLKIPPHLKCIATLPCEMSNVLKATTKNKMTFVTTDFGNYQQKTMCLLSQLLSEVTVTASSFFTSNVQCVLIAAGPRIQAGHH